MTRRHWAVAVVALLLVPVAPADAVATTGTTGTTSTVAAPDTAPPPVIDELVDPVDRTPDGPGAWVGAAALVGGLGAVVVAVAVVRRRPSSR